MSGEWAGVVAIVKDVATGLADIVAAAVAILGLNAWRRQLREHTEYDLARRVLRAVYRVRDELQGVRNPLIMGSEFEAARREAGIQHDQGMRTSTADDEIAVYDRRWTRVASAMSDLQVEVTEAEVIWGKTAAEQLAPLRRCVADLYSNLMLFFRHKERRAEGSQPDSEARERVERIVWKISDDPDQDPFTRKITDAVNQVESLARPRLKL